MRARPSDLATHLRTPSSVLHAAATRLLRPGRSIAWRAAANFPPCVASGKPIFGTELLALRGDVRHKALSIRRCRGASSRLCHAPLAAPSAGLAPAAATTAAPPSRQKRSGLGVEHLEQCRLLLSVDRTSSGAVPRALPASSSGAQALSKREEAAAAAANGRTAYATQASDNRRPGVFVSPEFMSEFSAYDTRAHLGSSYWLVRATFYS